MPLAAAAAVAAMCLAQLGCGGSADGRDGRLEVTARFLSSDQSAARDGIAGLRMCAEHGDLDRERCADVPLPSGDLVVALNVPPAEGWTVRLWAFDGRGRGLWSGRATMDAVAGESVRRRLVLSRCSELTEVPCEEGLDAAECGPSRQRAFHSATLLSDGRVLLAGGFSSLRRDVTCDPACATPHPDEPGVFIEEALTGGEGDPETRTPCTPSCRILEAGDSAKIYDPVEGKVTRELGLSAPRAMHTATITADGRHVILAGGVSSARLYMDGGAPLIVPEGFHIRGDGKATAEVLHAFLLSTVREVGLAGPRFMHAAVEDGDEGVLLIGGMTVEDGSLRMVGAGGAPPPRLELVEPAGAVPAGLTGITDRRGHEAVRVGDLAVVIGGNDVSLQDPGFFAEVYNLGNRTSRPLGDAEEGGARQRHYAPLWLTLTPLPGGRLLALGGMYEHPFLDPDLRPVPALNPINAGLLVDLESSEIEPLRMLAPRAAHAAVALEDGRVLVMGGLTMGERLRVTRSMEVIDVEAREAEPLLGRDERPLQLRGGRFGHAAVLLRDGSVLGSGGLATVDPEGMGRETPCSVVACDLDVYNPSACELSPPVADSLLD